MSLSLITLRLPPAVVELERCVWRWDRQTEKADVFCESSRSTETAVANHRPPQRQGTAFHVPEVRSVFRSRRGAPADGSRREPRP